MDKPLTIARAVLELRVDGVETVRKHGEDSNDASKVAAEYLSDSKGFSKRIAAIMGKAAECGAHTLILPECALVWRDQEQLKAYRKSAKKIFYVVGGQLHLPRKGYGKHLSGDTIVWLKGKALGYINVGETHWLLGGKGFSVISTLIDLKGKSEPELGIVVLKMLPVHFAPRYERPLMKNIHTLKRHPRKAAIILPYWKMTNAASKEYPMTSNSRPEYQYKRHIIPYGSADGKDFVDIIRFKSLKVQLNGG